MVDVVLVLTVTENRSCHLAGSELSPCEGLAPYGADVLSQVV